MVETISWSLSVMKEALCIDGVSKSRTKSLVHQISSIWLVDIGPVQVGWVILWKSKRLIAFAAFRLVNSGNLVFLDWFSLKSPRSKTFQFLFLASVNQCINCSCVRRLSLGWLVTDGKYVEIILVLLEGK